MKILSIRLGRASFDHYLPWQAGKNGEFRMRIAYRLCTTLRLSKEKPQSLGTSSEHDGGWSLLWDATAQPRAKHF